MTQNIAGENVILGASRIKDVETFIEQTAEKFAKTPVFSAEQIGRGVYRHIGEGVWMHRCHGCDDFILSYGNISYLYEFASHEATHEDVLAAGIAGWNVGMLPA